MLEDHFGLIQTLLVNWCLPDIIKNMIDPNKTLRSMTVQVRNPISVLVLLGFVEPNSSLWNESIVLSQRSILNWLIQDEVFEKINHFIIREPGISFKKCCNFADIVTYFIHQSCYPCEMIWRWCVLSVFLTGFPNPCF